MACIEDFIKNSAKLALGINLNETNAKYIDL
jgi:hypothetical protein